MRFAATKKLMMLILPVLAVLTLFTVTIALPVLAQQKVEPEDGQVVRLELLVDEDLVHRIEGPAAKRLGQCRTFVASDDRYIGVAAKCGQPFVEVMIFRSQDSRLERKLTLQPPATADFNLFGFTIADGGELCILNGLVKHYVFRKQELVGTFDFVSRVADIRGDELLWSLESDAPPPSVEFNEDPPLLVISDLGQRMLQQDEVEVLTKVDIKQVDRSDAFAVSNLETFGRFRKDGKIWTAGAYSGRIQLLSRTAKVLLELQLDQEAEPVDQEALKAQLLASVSMPLHDPNPAVDVMTPSKNPIVISLATAGNDLLLRPSKYSKYHNQLIIYDAQLDRFYHFILPDALGQARHIAATEDAVWFNKPLSWIEIDELMALVWAEQ